MYKKEQKTNGKKTDKTDINNKRGGRCNHSVIWKISLAFVWTHLLKQVWCTLEVEGYFLLGFLARTCDLTACNCPSESQLELKSVHLSMKQTQCSVWAALRSCIKKPRRQVMVCSSLSSQVNSGDEKWSLRAALSVLQCGLKDCQPPACPASLHSPQALFQ